MSTRTVTKIPPAPDISDWQMTRAMETLLALRSQLAAIDPTIEDDPRLYEDMLDAEGGDALTVLENVIRSSNEDDRLAELAKTNKADLAQRQSRFERRRDVKRRAAFAAFSALDLPTMQRHDFTAFRHAGRSHVLITNIDASDLQPFVRIEKIPDKDGIGKELRAGRRLEGAELSNPEPGLTVRVR